MVKKLKNWIQKITADDPVGTLRDNVQFILYLFHCLSALFLVCILMIAGYKFSYTIYNLFLCHFFPTFKFHCIECNPAQSLIVGILGSFEFLLLAPIYYYIVEAVSHMIAEGEQKEYIQSKTMFFSSIFSVLIIHVTVNLLDGNSSLNNRELFIIFTLLVFIAGFYYVLSRHET